MLDIWPELPLFLDGIDGASEETRDDLAVAFGLNHRVSGIRLENVPPSEWETISPLMQHPFPFLTYLWIQPHYRFRNAIARSFLGGSATCLRDLGLVGVAFPALPELLLSTTNLVRLFYGGIPRRGYISPQAMVIGLSALTRLESLSLVFPSSHDRPIRITPPHTRTPLPALTYIRFRGVPEYLEDLVAQIDAPLLESMVIELFYHDFEVSELAKFVRRTDKLSSVDRAEVTFGPERVSIMLSPESLGQRVDPKTLMLNSETSWTRLRLSHLARFCASCLPPTSPLESLHIFDPYRDSWQGTIDDPDPRWWLELLRPFNNVKDLYLSRHVAPHVAQALRGLPVERVTEVLPALENVAISWPESVEEAMSEFAAARQFSGHPVSICDWGEYERYPW
jgi:hypothetical protein